MALTISQLKIGRRIIHQNIPHEIIEARHQKLGRGQAKVIAKLRNLLNAAIIQVTYSGDDRIEEAAVNYRDAVFLYRDTNSNKYFFMINDNFEQAGLSLKERTKDYLTDGVEVKILFWNDQAIDVILPPKVCLKVVEAKPNIRGDSANAPVKEVIVETGLKLLAPIFIEKGDNIWVSTDSGAYSRRA